MPGWEAIAAKGGEFFNDMLTRAMRNNSALSDFFGLNPPQPEKPLALQIAKANWGPLNTYLAAALRGEGGMSEAEMSAQQQEAERGIGRQRTMAEQKLNQGSFGSPMGATQNRLAGLYSDSARAGAQNRLNLYLMQQQLKRQAQSAAANSIMGAGTTGYNQYIQGAFPYEAGAWQANQNMWNQMGGSMNEMLAAMMMQSMANRNQAPETQKTDTGQQSTFNQN